MLRKLIIVLLLASPLFATEQLAFDASNSSIAFTASKVVMGSQSGEFKRFQGSIRFDEGKAESSGVSVQIEMDSVVADAGGLTRHLKTADFFDVKRYPRSTFTSTAVRRRDDGRYLVTGVLDFHGVKKAITFPAAIRYDAQSVAVDAELTISRKDFGIEYESVGDNFIKDAVVLRLEISAPRPPAR
jgi:polyisoprenoid-binding protein YceI